MALDMPAVTAQSEHRTITLGELRDLVDAAEHLPADTIVRAKSIPFHLPDLFEPAGARCNRLALDVHREPS